MSTKLTLLVDENVISDAKKYAKKQGRSVSKIVEDYLRTVAKPSKKNKKTIDPVVKNLWGSVNLSQKNSNYDELLKDALLQKYIK